MRELTQVECQTISAGNIEVHELVYQGVYGTVNSALLAALQRVGGTNPVAAAIFGGLSAMAAYAAGDSAAGLYDRLMDRD